VEQNLALHDGLEDNSIAGNIKDMHEGSPKVPSASLQIPKQQQSQETIVCCERQW